MCAANACSYVELTDSMTDRMTPEQRHKCMSHIRGKDTRPEMIVRRWLWAEGFRYRLHAPRLPGKPDIVMRKLKTVIFINGCFWHGHKVQVDGEAGQLDGISELTDSQCCKIPNTNREFWLKKITANRQRDYRNYGVYLAEGWHVLVVWECMLKPSKRAATLAALSQRVNSIFLDSVRQKSAPYSIEEESHDIAAEDTPEYGPKRPLCR